MRKLGFGIIALSLALGCTAKSDRGPFYHAFERVNGQECLVTHDRQTSYTYLGGHYYQSESGGPWRMTVCEDIATIRRQTPVLVGNNGLGLGRSGGLATLAKRLAKETHIAVAIESILSIDLTVERTNLVLAEGGPVFVAGYSAGCEAIAVKLGSTINRVTVFMIEPTYQRTIGYTRLPDRVSKLVCFRIADGNILTFSGRFYEPWDFENPNTPFENIRLSTKSHIAACNDPKVFQRFVTEIATVKNQSPAGIASAK